MPSSFYKVLDDQNSADVCLSTMDGTPNPTVNAYMAVLIRKVSGAKHWKISAAVVLINGVMWLKDVHIVRPQVGEVYLKS